jgi:nucleoside-diphosphate-sugar epimerase
LPAPAIRVARLSNVVGLGDRSNNFLSAVLDEARTTHAVTIHGSPDSEKDYVALDDVTALGEAIALRGQHRLYNVASGRNVPHRLIADLLRQHTGAKVSFAPNARRVIFPPINIGRVRSEFQLNPTPFEAVFSELVREGCPRAENLSTFDR